EAAIGLDALDVLGTGQIPIYFERTTGGQEPLFGYLTVLSMLALGPNVLAMRLVAPIVGLLTVAVTYVLGKEMLGRWVGLIAALLIAVSYWHVHVSHTSFRAITLPLMVGLTFLLFWRALKRESLVSYVLAGLAGAVTMYTYQSSRLFPLLLGLAFLYLWICRGRGLPWKGMATFAGVTGALTLPLAWYYLGHPDLFSARIDQVGAGGTSFLGSLTNALGMFSYRGDITWKFNLPGKPVFDLWDSALFYLGVVVSLRRWRKPPYGLLLLWVAVMLLPTALSTESPHFLRALGIMPAVYLLPGVGAVWLAGWVRRWTGGFFRGRDRAFVYLALAAWLVSGAVFTYRDYFGEWAHSPKAYEVYNGDVEDAARYLNTLDGSQVVMFSTQYYGHYTVLFFERR
ncbi:MAG: glycosyltransferase family 39 protein, partial [Dehalococcoidia bacterium]|nr:glycosyltransferase family 39 protein [Dehalococcoidia bacterium]